MRIAILFMCLVVVCKGYYVRDELSELLELLKKTVIPIQKTNVVWAKFMRSEGVMPPPEEPMEYDLDRLFQFPGSNFLLRLIEKNFSDPTPLSHIQMEEFPMQPGNPNMYFYIREMAPKWTAATYMFYGDWAGLTDLFTKRITEWVAYRRFACPSVVFDKIFVRWNFIKMKGMFESEDNSVYEYFRERLPRFFPTYQGTNIDAIAREATVSVHWWIMDEIMQHIIGYGMKDVAVFSHKLYRNLLGHYQSVSNMGWNTYKTSLDILRDVITRTLQDSNVRCQAGTEVLHRYSEAIAMFKSRYEEYSIMAIRSGVMNFLLGKLEGEPTTVGFDEATLGEITAKIKEYFDGILAEFIKYEPYFTTSGLTSLENFFRDVMEPEELPLLSDLFQRLGLYPDNVNNVNVNIGGQNPAGPNSVMPGAPNNPVP